MLTACPGPEGLSTLPMPGRGVISEIRNERTGAFLIYKGFLALG